MFIFAHLFAGTVFGLVIARLIRDPGVIPFCIAGAILPDFIDKTLGYLLLPQVLDSGRTFFHSLIIAGIIILLALVVYRYRRTLIVAGFAAALLVHQFLDAMWQEPVTWFYPLLGPFQPYHYINYFKTYFWLEISSASEWVFLFATLVLLSFEYDNLFRKLVPSYIPRWKVTACYAVLLLLCITGGFALAAGMPGWKNVMAPYNTPESNLIMGVLALGGCGILHAYLPVRRSKSTGT